MALNGLFCDDVPLRNYSPTQSPKLPYQCKNSFISVCSEYRKTEVSCCTWCCRGECGHVPSCQQVVLE